MEEEIKKIEKPQRLTKKQIVYSRIKRRILARHILLARLGVLAAILSAFFLVFVVIVFIAKKTGLDFYFDLAKSFVFTPKDQVSQIGQKTNILILGKPGGGHTAPDLTDTIILASVSHIKGKPEMIFVSLPRDIWLPDLRAKLNSVYYWGNQKQQGGGLILAKSAVEEIVGVPVHYVVVFDFSSFEKLIDLLGGVEVDVQRSFEDKRFPILGRENDECDGDPDYNCRYEVVRFEKGTQIMDGDMALKFVRSRYSEDLEEGTDLARSKRQQLIVKAILAKILSSEIIFSPEKIKRIFLTLEASIETDILPRAAAILARRALDSRNSLSSYVLPEELLINPPLLPQYDNLYVFIPKASDWSEVQDWVRGIY